jgi:hypothetical protein
MDRALDGAHELGYAKGHMHRPKGLRVTFQPPKAVQGAQAIQECALMPSAMASRRFCR